MVKNIYVFPLIRQLGWWSSNKFWWLGQWMDGIIRTDDCVWAFKQHHYRCPHLNPVWDLGWFHWSRDCSLGSHSVFGTHPSLRLVTTPGLPISSNSFNLLLGQLSGVPFHCSFNFPLHHSLHCLHHPASDHGLGCSSTKGGTTVYSQWVGLFQPTRE